MKSTEAEEQERLEVTVLPMFRVALPPKLARAPLLAAVVVPRFVPPSVAGFLDPLQKSLRPLVPTQVVVAQVGTSTILSSLSE